jgi:hypothetical protein
MLFFAFVNFESLPTNIKGQLYFFSLHFSSLMHSGAYINRGEICELGSHTTELVLFPHLFHPLLFNLHGTEITRISNAGLSRPHPFMELLFPWGMHLKSPELEIVKC